MAWSPPGSTHPTGLVAGLVASTFCWLGRWAGGAARCGMFGWDAFLALWYCPLGGCAWGDAGLPTWCVFTGRWGVGWWWLAWLPPGSTHPTGLVASEVGRIHLLLVEAWGGRGCAVWDVWVGCVLGAVVILARWGVLGGNAGLPTWCVFTGRWGVGW
ncbi:MAG: hypothetical protein U1A77_17250 [Pirellulales bacterium]